MAEPDEAGTGSERGARETGVLPVLALLALACAASGAAALGAFDPAWARALGVPALLFGAGLPLVLRRTPEPPPVLKALLVAGLVSPVIALVAFLGLRAGLGLAAPAAAGWTLLASAPLQLVGLGCRVRFHRPSATGLLCLALAGALVVFTAGAVLQGSALRLSHHGLLHAGLAAATERALPPGNPWMAEAPLAYYWVWHAFASFVGRALGVAPTFAFAAIGIWSAAALGLAFGALAQGLFKSGWAAVLGVTFGLFGLNALGGYNAAFGAELTEAPTTAGQLLASLRELFLWGSSDAPPLDPRAAFGPSKFANPSSYPAALALAVGGLFTGLHALRHGSRPWVGATALCLGASAAINPLVGFPAAACVLGPALLARPLGARPGWLGPALVLALVPALWALLEASSQFSGAAVAFGPSAERFFAALWPVLLLLPLAVCAPLAATAPPERSQARSGFALLILLGVGGAAGAWLLRLPYANEYKFVRLSGVGFGLLAGGGAQALLARGGVARVLGVLFTVLALVGSGLSLFHGWAVTWSAAENEAPLVEGPEGLAPIGGDAAGRERAAVYRFLATNASVRASDPVLVTDPWTEQPLLYAGPDGRAFAFTTAQNLQGHEGPAFAQLDIYVDRPSQVLADAQPERRERYGALLRMLRSPEALPVADFTRLDGLGRPLVWLVGQQERLANLALPRRVAQMGFGEVGRVGETLLFARPPEFAEQLRTEFAAEVPGAVGP